MVGLDLDIPMGARRSKENAQIAVCSSLLDATTQNNYFYNTSFTSQALSVGEACPVTDLLLTNLTLSQTSSDVQGFVNPPRVRGKGQGFFKGFISLISKYKLSLSNVELEKISSKEASLPLQHLILFRIH